MTDDVGERSPDVAVLVSYSGDGGVERMINHLIAGMLASGYRVDVLVLKRIGGHFANLPAGARVVPLGTRHAYLAVWPLVRYLRRVAPPALLVAKDRAARAALRARRLAPGPTRITLRVGNTLSQLLADRSRLYRRWRQALTRRLYPRADAIIAVSRGVADDLIETTGIAADRIHVVANPTITPDIDERAREATGHPWLDQDDTPVIVGVGRLTRQKDFPTLLRAFARLRRRRATRLIILGEGEDRDALARLARSLGIDDVLAMPGFVANPYPWMARADAFVLSSAWEGSPNALIEAMHLGVSVVASDCRSGPRELLEHGRIAPLVPVGDDAALAEAMVTALDDPPSAAVLRAAVADYQPSVSTARYLRVMGVAPEGERC